MTITPQMADNILFNKLIYRAVQLHPDFVNEIFNVLKDSVENDSNPISLKEMAIKRIGVIGNDSKVESPILYTVVDYLEEKTQHNEDGVRLYSVQSLGDLYKKILLENGHKEFVNLSLLMDISKNDKDYLVKGYAIEAIGKCYETISKDYTFDKQYALERIEEFDTDKNPSLSFVSKKVDEIRQMFKVH